MPSVDSIWTRERLQDEGPWILITITNPEIEVREGTALGLEFPAPRPMKALIDTGASVTVINPQVARTWKLRQTGFAQIVAAGSSGKYPEHAAAIGFPDTRLRTIDPIRVVACPIIRQPVSCLIGRDVLSRWLLSYDGRIGRFTID